jgi:hypothetical protein
VLSKPKHACQKHNRTRLRVNSRHQRFRTRSELAASRGDQSVPNRSAKPALVHLQLPAMCRSHPHATRRVCCRARGRQTALLCSSSKSMSRAHAREGARTRAAADQRSHRAQKHAAYAVPPGCAPSLVRSARSDVLTHGVAHQLGEVMWANVGKWRSHWRPLSVGSERARIASPITVQTSPTVVECRALRGVKRVRSRFCIVL